MRCRCSLHVLFVLLSFVAMTGAAEASSGVLVGRSSIAASVNSRGAGVAQAFKYTAVASGKAASISVYVNSGSSATPLVAGLYSNSSGHPSKLLAYGHVASATPGTWNAMNLSSSPSVSKSKSYWIAVLGPDGGLNLRDSSGRSGCSQNSSQTNLTSLPAKSRVGASSSVCSLSGYVSSVAAPLAPVGVSAPTNTAVPAVSGTAQVGDTLSTGTWSGSPTGYTYPWEHCDSTGRACAGIFGATGSNHTHASSDVGATVGVVVAATNAGGSGSARSAQTATSASPAPTAAFTYSPSAPSAGHSVSFDGSASTCIATPCSYTWADNPPGGGSWPLGSGQTMSFTFQIVSTKYVTLTVTDALNRSANVEHDVVVSAAAPTNTTAPAVTGQAVDGQALTTSNGTWSGSPTSYAYLWQDCNSSGGSCVSVSGATSSSYTLQASDVGSTIRSVVTATNAGGSTPATSAQTATVSAPPAPTVAFTYSPSAPSAGHSVSFDGRASTCIATPCSYTWADNPPGGGSWPLGSGQTMSFTFQIVSTKYVTLTVTDALNRSANVEHDVVVSAAAPTNTTAPAVTGQAVNGQALTTSNGTWSGSPTSYAYRWQDCNSSGASCVNMAGATSSSYTLQGGDVGSTIRSVVTATNAGGSTSGSSAATSMVSGTVSGLSCSINATTTNYASQIAAANPGQVVCLASGNYSGFTGTSKSAPGITITSAPGAAVTFNSGMTMNLSSVQNFTLDGTGGGGTMTVGGELDMETSGDALQNKALNLTFQNIAFNATSDVLVQGPENSNITFNRDTFVAGNAACSGGSSTGTSWQFLLPYKTATSATPSGVTAENSVWVAPTDLWNPRRAIQTASPLTVQNNVFTGYLDHTEAASCNHIDGLQIFSQLNGTWGNVIFTGNLCYDVYGCFMAFDGTSHNTITDNACFDTETACISLYADAGSVVNHNVQETRGADPGGCLTIDDPSAPIQACTSSQLLINSHKTGSPATTGETFSNNIDPSAPNVDAGSLTVNTNNLWPGASSPNIGGSATFAAGTNPTTWAAFELTAGSTGHGAGSDGQDMGVRASAGGPPTGGGTVPVNTALPALSGTATRGQTLSTTDGTWTITGNVPKATTYQWFDCPTSVYTPASCPAIEAQTAPLGTNGSTYTLQASDIGDYVFSQVTITNANGQVNAISNASGPIGA